MDVRRFVRGRRPGIGPLAGLATTASTLLQLLLSPVLGLADNGDYKRILRPLHLAAEVPPGRPARFQYIWLHYAPAPTAGSGYQSTELELVHAVRSVATALGSGPTLDLRLIGAVHAVLLGIAVWLLVRALPGFAALRAITAALLVVCLTDTRFTVYLDSFFTEPASLLATLLLLAAVLHAGRRPRLSHAVLLGFTAAGAALLASKSQNAILVLPMAAVLVCGRVEWPRWRLVGRRWGRVPGAGCAVLLVALSVSYLRSQPPDLNRDNRYNAVFVEILGHSSDPARDLTDLGLSPELARYAGRPIYNPANATHDPHFAGFFTTITELKLAGYYVTHPGRALSLAHRGATASMYLRPVGVSPPLGNQTLASGAPPSYTACKLCIYSAVSEYLRPASAVLLPALWLAGLTVGIALLRPFRRSVTGDPTANRWLGIALLLTLSFAVVSMAVALLGEGAFEIVKHLYLTSACDALLAVLTLHGAGVLVSGRRRSAAAR